MSGALTIGPRLVTVGTAEYGEPYLAISPDTRISVRARLDPLARHWWQRRRHAAVLDVYVDNVAFAGGCAGVRLWLTEGYYPVRLGPRFYDRNGR